MRFMGFISLIPTTVLLTASFFVLFAIEKVAGKGLKTFGKFVAALLIIVAALIFSKGVYTVVTGKCPIMSAMQEMCPMMGGAKSGMMHDWKMRGEMGPHGGAGMMRGQMQPGMQEPAPTK